LHVNQSKIVCLGGRFVYRVTGTFLHDSSNSKERKLDVLTNVTQKAVSTIASTDHSTHDKAHGAQPFQQTKSSEDVHNEFSVDKLSVDSPSDAVNENNRSRVSNQSLPNADKPIICTDFSSNHMLASDNDMFVFAKYEFKGPWDAVGKRTRQAPVEMKVNNQPTTAVDCYRTYKHCNHLHFGQ